MTVSEEGHMRDRRDFPQQLDHPRGATLRRLADRVLVAFREGADNRAQELLEPFELCLEQPEEGPDHVAPAGRLNHSSLRAWARTVDGSPFDAERREQLVAELEDQLLWLGAVYEAALAGSAAGEENGTAYDGPFRGRRLVTSALPDTLVVSITNPYLVSFDDLYETYLAEEDLQPWPADHYLGEHVHVLRLPQPLHRTAYDVREHLRDRMRRGCNRDLTRRFEDRFGFVPSEALGVRFDLTHMPAVVPTADGQWNLERIQVDPRAWGLTRGDPDVLIGVLDTPVDLSPALASPRVQSAVLLGDSPGGPAPDDHGTMCASVAAADGSQAPGVDGIAPACSVLPLGFRHWTDMEVAEGIGRLLEADVPARVLSMSFGFDLWNPAVIDPLLEQAYHAGVVLCAATQNDNLGDGVTYPATHPLVIAVGAADEDDEHWTEDELRGSNYGPELSLVAPGENVAAVGPGGTATSFAATSAATPHVAGVAALLLSHRSDLCNDDVREILERTAAKIGNHQAVSGYVHGDWDQKVGYGLVDAAAALEMATEWPHRPADETCVRTWQPGQAGAPAGLGPIIVLGPDVVDSADSSSVPYLDVQPTVADACRTLEEHATGAPLTGYHEDGEPLPAPLDLTRLEAFDRSGRPLAITTDGSTVALHLAGGPPREAEVMRRVDTVLQRLQQNRALLDPLPTGFDGGALPQLGGNYASFQTFVWDLLLVMVRPPWAHKGNWFHNAIHKLF